MSNRKITRRKSLKLMAATALAAQTPRLSRAANDGVDVLIMGAGLSGLYAALLLEEAGLTVRIVEGRDRVGGRVYTLYDIPGEPEAGGEVFGLYYARCLDMMERLGLEQRAPRPRSQATDDQLMMNIRGENILLPDWAAHPRNPHPDALKPFTPWQVFFGELPKDNPLQNLDDWFDPRYAAHDVSFADYLRNQYGFDEESIRLQQVNSAYGNTAYDVTALHIFHYFLWARLQASGGSRTQCVGGNQRLPEGMFDLIQGDVIFEQPVQAIEARADGVRVRTTDGKVLGARYALSTLPFSLLRYVDMDPPLSGLQKQAIETLSYYKTYQIHYAFKRKFWEDDGLPPSLWTDSPVGRINLLTDENGEPACYLVYVNGLQAAYLDRLTPKEADRFVQAELARLRPASKGQLKALRIHSNQNDPFIGGSYAYWSPGMPHTFPGIMAEPAGRLHFAGEHTALVNRGMEGAMESGERAALEILERV